MENLSPCDEKMLLSRIASGDERAFKQLFEQWHPLLATHIYRVTQSQPLTEEIVQDVFLKIWKSKSEVTCGVQFRKHITDDIYFFH